MKSWGGGVPVFLPGTEAVALCWGAARVRQECCRHSQTGRDWITGCTPARDGEGAAQRNPAPWPLLRPGQKPFLCSSFNEVIVPGGRSCGVGVLSRGREATAAVMWAPRGQPPHLHVLVGTWTRLQVGISLSASDISMSRCVMSPLVSQGLRVSGAPAGTPSGLCRAGRRGTLRETTQLSAACASLCRSLRPMPRGHTKAARAGTSHAPGRGSRSPAMPSRPRELAQVHSVQEGNETD